MVVNRRATWLASRHDRFGQPEPQPHHQQPPEQFGQPGAIAVCGIDGERDNEDDPDDDIIRNGEEDERDDDNDDPEPAPAAAAEPVITLHAKLVDEAAEEEMAERLRKLERERLQERQQQITLERERLEERERQVALEHELLLERERSRQLESQLQLQWHGPNGESAPRLGDDTIQTVVDNVLLCRTITTGDEPPDEGCRVQNHPAPIDGAGQGRYAVVEPILETTEQEEQEDDDTTEQGLDINHGGDDPDIEQEGVLLPEWPHHDDGYPISKDSRHRIIAIVGWNLVAIGIVAAAATGCSAAVAAGVSSPFGSSNNDKDAASDDHDDDVELDDSFCALLRSLTDGSPTIQVAAGAVVAERNEDGDDNGHNLISGAPRHVCVFKNGDDDDSNARNGGGTNDFVGYSVAPCNVANAGGSRPMVAGGAWWYHHHHENDERRSENDNNDNISDNNSNSEQNRAVRVFELDSTTHEWIPIGHDETESDLSFSEEQQGG